MNVKAKLATILRALADRLAPAPVGNCSSGAMRINVGYSDFTPPVIYSGSGNQA